MGERCETCRFWRGPGDTWAGYAPCRRYPPENEPHGRGGVVSVWIKTSLHDWCGEYAPLTPETSK